MPHVRLAAFDTKSKTAKLTLCEQNLQPLVGRFELQVLKIHVKNYRSNDVAVLACNLWTHIELSESREGKFIYTPLDIIKPKSEEIIVTKTSWMPFADASELVFWLQDPKTHIKQDCQLEVLFQYRKTA